MVNGTDRNKDGQITADRPDISNPAAPLNTRGIFAATAPPASDPLAPPGKGWCPSGFSNPDIAAVAPLTLTCINPNTVHWIEGSGLPNANTVGRNTMLAPGLDNLNLAIAKRFKLTEGTSLEYRVEMFNALNTANFGNFVAPR